VIVILVAAACTFESNTRHANTPKRIVRIGIRFDVSDEVLMSATFLSEIDPNQKYYGHALLTVYPGPGPFTAAPPLWSMGTETVTVAVAELPNESVTLKVIV